MTPVRESLITVIIPVYGAERFIERTVRSVLSQTFTEWELILVDDCSPDGSGMICDSLAMEDKRIRVIHRTQNGGLSAARNTGLDNALGRFVTFIDADDTVDPLYLATLMRLQRETGAKITTTLYQKFDDGTEPRTYPSGDTVTLPPLDALDDMLHQLTIDNSACGKLYDISLWKDLRFRTGIGYEDLDIMPLLLLRTNALAFNTSRLYFYRQHPASYIHSFNPRRADVLDVTARICTLVSREAPQLIPAARDREFAAAFNILLLAAANGYNDPSLRRRCLELIRSNRRASLTGRRIRRKNRLGALLSYFPGAAAIAAICSLIKKK